MEKKSTSTSTSNSIVEQHENQNSNFGFDFLNPIYYVDPEDYKVNIQVRSIANTILEKSHSTHGIVPKKSDQEFEKKFKESKEYNTSRYFHIDPNCGSSTNLVPKTKNLRSLYPCNKCFKKDTPIYLGENVYKQYYPNNYDHIVVDFHYVLDSKNHCLKSLNISFKKNCNKYYMYCVPSDMLVADIAKQVFAEGSRWDLKKDYFDYVRWENRNSVALGDDDDACRYTLCELDLDQDPTGMEHRRLTDEQNKKLEEERRCNDCIIL